MDVYIKPPLRVRFLVCPRVLRGRLRRVILWERVLVWEGYFGRNGSMV